MDDTLKHEVETLRADLKQVRNDLAAVTKTLRERTAKEAIDGLDSVKQAGERLEATMRQAAAEAQSGLERQVRDRPLGSLLLAFGIGMLLGKAVSRD